MGSQLKCVVVDDEPLARKGLVDMLSHYQGIEVIGEANSVSSFREILEVFQPDIVFLDLMLRDRNILDHLDKTAGGPRMIITTAYPQYALKGYEFEAVDYLLKPVSPQDLERAVSRVTKQLQSEKIPEQFVYLRVNGRYHRIAYDDILYLQGMENYVVVHCEDRRLITKGTMIGFERILPKNDFIRVHKSYIVNRTKVDVIDKLTLMVKEQFIPISRENRNSVYTSLMGG